MLPTHLQLCHKYFTLECSIGKFNAPAIRWTSVHSLSNDSAIIISFVAIRAVISHNAIQELGRKIYPR